jgi:peptidyl-prolyl cis-trans isomerase SurA
MFWAGLACALASLATAQPAGVAPKTGKAAEALFTFANGHSVGREEFEVVFRKNMGVTKRSVPLVPAPTREQVRAYLDLYINFQRKVMEATRLGLDTTQSFKDELKSYIAQLSQSYLFEKEVLAELIDEAYRRAQTEVRASHILLSLPPDAGPDDTLRVHKKIMLLRDSIVRGALTFAQVAARYSDDPGGRKMGGDLGFFSVLDMVYPFETGAYSTPVGQFSMPVRSQFGYHLIWVRDRIPYQGNRRASHIVILHADAAGKRDTIESLHKAEELYKRLQKGEPFDKLAEQFSQDPNTAAQGGDLGTSRLFPSLEEAKRYLNLNEYSRPIYTPYGWHIIKVTELFPIQSFDEARMQIKNRIVKDSRVRTAQGRLVAQLQKKYHYKFYRAAESALMQHFAEVKDKAPALWDGAVPPAVQKQVLFSFADKDCDVAQFLFHLKTVEAKLDQPEKVFAEIDRFAASAILRYEESRLPQQSADFRELAREYHDGILLFTLMEQKVWRPAVEDTAALRAFYNTHKNKFDVSGMLRLFTCTGTDSSALVAYRDQFASAGTAAKAAVRPVAAGVSASEEALAPSQPRYQQLAAMGPGRCTGIMRENGLYRIDCIAEVLQPGADNFEMVRADVVKQYQQQLEDAWLAELAQKYPVVVNEKVFNKLFK